MHDLLPRARRRQLALDPLPQVGVRAVPVAGQLGEDRAKLADPFGTVLAHEAALDQLLLGAMWHRHRDVTPPFSGRNASRPAASLGRCGGKRRTSRFGGELLRARIPSRAELSPTLARWSKSASRRARRARCTWATRSARSRTGASPTSARDGCCCGSTTPMRPGTSRAGSRRSWATSSGSGSAGTKGRCRQSERHVRHREAAHLVGEPDSEGALRFGRTTLLRPDGSPTYQLATAVDDLDFEITHVLRGSDHRANTELQTRADPRSRRRAARVHLPRPAARARRAEAVEAARGVVARRLAGAGIPRGSGTGVSRGARAAAARRPPRPRARAPALDRDARGVERRGARGARRRAGLGGAGAARCAGSRRGARVRGSGARAGGGRGGLARDVRPRPRARRQPGWSRGRSCGS